MTQDQADKLRRKALAAMIFTPRTPISRAEHLAGRRSQINRIIEAVFQAGAHAIIYGERGVGKTSLAECVSDILTVAQSKGKPVIAPRINCDGTDQYSSIWEKVFSKIAITHQSEPMGFNRLPESFQATAAEELPERITPHDVLRILQKYGADVELVLILDEFDRLPVGDVTKLIADTIKTLSDHAVPATVLIVGVGDSVTELIRGHESIGRHLVEVPMPRMSKEEQTEIITNRIPKLDLEIASSALSVVSSFSRGFPFYVHLLGQKAALEAIDQGDREITSACIGRALGLAIADSEREMNRIYYEATKSAQRNNLYRETLAACAMTSCDEFGYFTPSSICPPLSRILGKAVPITSFNERLKEFATPNRAEVLQQAGEKRNRRYRFRDPLMEPFVVMKSIDEGLIELEQVLAAMESDSART